MTPPPWNSPELPFRSSHRTRGTAVSDGTGRFEPISVTIPTAGKGNVSERLFRTRLLLNRVSELVGIPAPRRSLEDGQRARHKSYCSLLVPLRRFERRDERVIKACPAPTSTAFWYDLDAPWQLLVFERGARRRAYDESDGRFGSLGIASGIEKGGAFLFGTTCPSGKPSPPPSPPARAPANGARSLAQVRAWFAANDAVRAALRLHDGRRRGLDPVVAIPPPPTAVDRVKEDLGLVLALPLALAYCAFPEAAAARAATMSASVSESNAGPGRPGISSNPSTSLISNSFSMILEPLILTFRVLDN